MQSDSIGEKIKALRLKNNLTLEQVGNAVGVGKSTVRKWENGMIANMRRDKIVSLAKALNTTPAYLLGFSEEPASTVSLDDTTNMYGRFEQMLQEKGLTAYKVSKATGIAQATFSDWKNGKSVPKLNKMIKIAEFLEVPLEWLQGTSEQKEKPHGQAEELKENEIIIRGRDGSCIRKVLTPEQIQAFKTMVDSLPDAPDDI